MTTGRADWGLSFDFGGWSEAPVGSLITGLERSGEASAGDVNLFRLEAATYTSSIFSEPCMDADWSASWDNDNTWANCPEGTAIRGLYRSPGDDAKLHYIETGK